MNDIDLSFRPETYWPESLTPGQQLSRIRGKARQDIARRIYENEGFRGLNDFLVREGLTEAERTAWGGVHPECLGGEFLPVLDDTEVEIARISMASTTIDQISVRARKNGGAIRYRIVGEYEEDEGMRHQLPFEASEQPLTLAQLIELIDGAYIPDCAYPGGIFTSNWLMMNEFGYDVEDIVGFLSLSSPFYPQLSACYQTLGYSWVEDNQEQDDEEE